MEQNYVTLSPYVERIGVIFCHLINYAQTTDDVAITTGLSVATTIAVYMCCIRVNSL